jgi:hypothetical protein
VARPVDRPVEAAYYRNRSRNRAAAGDGAKSGLTADLDLEKTANEEGAAARARLLIDAILER